MSRFAPSLTGTATLTGFTVRRDRVRIVVWVSTITLLVIATVASVKGLYPDQADLDAAARASEDNAAAIIFNGPPQSLDTLGGQVAFQTGSFGLVLMGLMSVFMLGRLTRGDEEAGRAELVRSLAVGAQSLPAAATITVAVMNVVAGALVGAALVVQGLPVAGSIAFGLSFTMFGLLLGAVTLVAAQITENTRVVYGVGGIVIGASFVLRAVGDIGDGTLSWLSPIGWAQKTRPFAGETWWPFLILIVATVGLIGLSAALSHRRDLGAGLVPPRTGRARAAPSLGTPVGLATRLQRGSLVGWALGVAVLAAAYGSITDSIKSFVEDNQAITDLIAAQGQGTLVEQYVSMSFRILALIAAGFAIQSALRVQREESALHVEQVLATPVSRLRFAASHLAIAFGGALAVLALAGITYGAFGAAVTGDAAIVGQSVVASLVYVPAVWVLVGLTMLLIGVAPEATALTWVFLGICFVFGMLGQLLGLPSWVEDVSPFQHVPHYPATALTILPLVTLVAVAAGLTWWGLAGYRRRDLG